MGKGIEREAPWTDHAGYAWRLLLVGEVEDEIAGFASGFVGIKGYVEDGAFVSCSCSGPAVGYEEFGGSHSADLEDVSGHKAAAFWQIAIWLNEGSWAAVGVCDEYPRSELYG